MEEDLELVENLLSKGSLPTDKQYSGKESFRLQITKRIV